MKFNIFKILNSALGKLTSGEFEVLYYVLNGMRLTNRLELKIQRDVMLDSFGGKLSSRSLHKYAMSLEAKGYLGVSKNKNNFYTFSLKVTTPKKEPQTRKEEYCQQLEHPLWLKKRDVILERDHHQCALCGSTTNLQVHHIRYSQGKKAWEYPNAVLLTLCNECHQKVHSDPNHKLNPYRQNN